MKSTIDWLRNRSQSWRSAGLCVVIVSDGVGISSNVLYSCDQNVVPYVSFNASISPANFFDRYV